ncbi:unnamed protein product, partial [Symbiodinium sp. CCMP2456]
MCFQKICHRVALVAVWTAVWRCAKASEEARGWLYDPDYFNAWDIKWIDGHPRADVARVEPLRVGEVAEDMRRSQPLSFVEVGDPPRQLLGRHTESLHWQRGVRKVCHALVFLDCWVDLSAEACELQTCCGNTLEIDPLDHEAPNTADAEEAEVEFEYEDVMRHRGNRVVEWASELPDAATPRRDRRRRPDPSTTSTARASWDTPTTTTASSSGPALIPTAKPKVNCKSEPQFVAAPVVPTLGCAYCPAITVTHIRLYTGYPGVPEKTEPRDGQLSRGLQGQPSSHSSPGIHPGLPRCEVLISTIRAVGTRAVMDLWATPILCANLAIQQLRFVDENIDDTAGSKQPLVDEPTRHGEKLVAANTVRYLQLPLFVVGTSWRAHRVNADNPAAVGNTTCQANALPPYDDIEQPPGPHVYDCYAGTAAASPVSDTARVVGPENLRYSVLSPGRLLHVRLQLAAPFDLLCTYQWAWNPGKQAFQGKHRISEMIKQRREIWQGIDKWLGGRSQSSFFALAGDFNASLTPEQPICGTGVVASTNVQRALGQTDFAHELGQEIMRTMPQADYHAAQVLCPDKLLLAGWRQAVAQGPARQTPPSDDALTPQVQAMWQARGALHRLGVRLGRWRRVGMDPRIILQAWSLSVRLQTQTRALRRECRHKKIMRVAEVVQADNIFQAAKQFAPRNPRRRLQLRTADGHLQTHEAEFQQIVRHFETLYDGPASDGPVLSEAPGITDHEVEKAFNRLKPGKALPGSCAPVALWKQYREQLIPVLQLQFQHYLQPGAATLPRAWCLSELVLLPKPGKPMKSPAHLRPISLLHLQAKVLAAVLAARLQGPANQCLKQVPQYAYVGGRSLAQALERVIGHCACVRTLVSANTNNIHGKRQGRTGLGIYGGCHLSLDVSCAYDHVPWASLQQALREAKAPEPLIEAILLIHHTAGLHIKHCGLERIVSLKRGLRQGCGLSPLLWAVYCGWLLQGMHDPEILDITKTNTSYADDMHYAWTICNGRDLERAYAAMKHVLTHLLRHGLTISQGNRYFRFPLPDQVLHIKIETFKHRLTLARNTYSRLGKILRNRVVPVRLRMQLWLGCIWPALLHGLDCTGLPIKEMQTLQTQLLKQARAIANSHSMLTRETNVAFAARLRLPDPIRRLRRALELRVEADQFLHSTLSPGEAQQQWRTVVRGQLFACSDGWGDLTAATPSPSTVRLQPVDCVLHEVFSCEICGQEFSTQASLRRHMYCNHLDEEQQQLRDKEVKVAIQNAEMAHAKDGMPTCKHCLHEFSTWHAFNYHVNSRSCEFLRALYKQQATTQMVLPLLTDALIHSQEVLECANNCGWQDLALLPCIPEKHHHCVECNHWSAKPQYVRRHMSQKHPDCDALIQRCIQEIKDSKLGLTNPCQYCGQSYKRKDAHLRACIGVFNGVYLHRRMEMPPPTELMMATQELNLLRSMTGGLREPQEGRMEMDWAQDLDHEATDNDPDHSRNHPSKLSWSAPTSPEDKPPWRARKTQNQRAGTKEQDKDELQEVRNVVNLLSTLVLRQEAQRSITRQDTGFMIFVQTRTPQNLGQSLYHIGQAWHKKKREGPAALSSPMRVVLYQHLLEVIKDRFQAMMASPSSRSTAAGLGWISECGKQVHGIRWDPTSQQHVKDEQAETFTPRKIEEALDKLMIAATAPLVIQRFHATRPLAEEYQAVVLGMFLEVGLRLLSPARAASDERAGQEIVDTDATLWVRNPEWLSMMHSWANPELQHDAAEFLQFLMGRPQVDQRGLTVLWQARAWQQAQLCVVDEGQSVPLSLLPPGDLADDSSGSYSVQDLVDTWHRQQPVHAAALLAPAMILQAITVLFFSITVISVGSRMMVLLLFGVITWMILV